jgi:hypothetical protein
MLVGIYSTENNIMDVISESPKGSREIITPGVDLEDGIMKTKQNVIRNN